VNPFARSSSASNESARTVVSGSETITRMTELASVRLGDWGEDITATSLSLATARSALREYTLIRVRQIRQA
jgi:hypothetical protein